MVEESISIVPRNSDESERGLEFETGEHVDESRSRIAKFA